MHDGSPLGRFANQRLACAIAAASCVASGTSPSPAQDNCLEFQAEQMVLDPVQNEIELDGDVEVRCGRHHLHADTLQLRSEGDSLQVEGPAILTLCPCDTAPVSVGFRRANLCPSGDITLEDPSLRVGETSVFWLPWIWLRGPDRMGLLPPKLAWRGEEGALIGPGFRFPWKESNGSLAWMDLYVSGYTSGGFEVEPTIVTPSSNTTVRFDRMNGDLLRIRSHGVSRGDRASMGWRMDMAQGSRGRTGLLDLREAARPFDDGRAFIEVRPYSSGFLSSGLMTVGPRGEGPLHIGPALFADAGGAMGPSISWQLTSALRILGEESGSATQVAAMEARMIGGQWVGPLRLSLEGQSSFATIRMENEETNHLVAWTQSELSLPLVRRFSHVHHLVKPFARGMLLTSRISQEPDRSLQPSAIAQGERWLTVAGTRTSFGPVQDESGMLLELAGGHMGNLNQNGAQRALLGRFELRSGSLGLNAEGAVLSHNGKEGGIGMARTMVGRPHSVGAWFDLSYRSILDPAAVRAFTPSATRLAPVSELDRSGTSIALGGHIPMGLGMRLGATSDWDVGEQKWLAAGTGLEIVHPCNCLHGRAWVSRRVGRGGTDGWVTLEVR